MQCAFQGDETQRAAAQAMALSTAGTVLGREDSSTRICLPAHGRGHAATCDDARTADPGVRLTGIYSFDLAVGDQRPGGPRDQGEYRNQHDRCAGLFTTDVGGDIADPPRDSFRTAGYKASYRIASQLAQNEVLAQFADGTGGTFFHNRNDIDEGLREAGAAPAISYLLGFSPQNLKLDGSLHTLKVTFVHKSNYKIQARHGYFAPRHKVDPVEEAKQEIQEALFSQDEIRDLPVDLHTQFFKTDNFQARLAVLTHVDIKGVHFRKADGRTRDDLTVATAIFDENGNYVTGGEKIVQMKL